LYWRGVSFGGTFKLTFTALLGDQKFRFLKVKGDTFESELAMWSMRHVGEEASSTIPKQQTAADVDKR
jgi:hypothetical protein